MSGGYRKTDRQMPARVILPEPITVAKWWKNRSHDEIRLELSTYEGTNILNLRTWHTSKSDGSSVKHLPKLAEIFATAIERARELGLLNADSEIGT